MRVFGTIGCLGAVIALGILSGFTDVAQPHTSGPLGYTFTDVARKAGLDARNYFGGETAKKYILETTGSGVAFFDYDGDGWPDIFLVNGSRMEGFPPGREPTNHLFHNNHNGTFSDVTAQAGLVHHGWGQAVCVGDIDNDGFDDLFVTYWGRNVLYRNNGDGTFTDISRQAGVSGQSTRWGTGCAFLDYDRDGHLDLFVTNYIVFDPKTAPDPGSNPYCTYLGLSVNCGPRGSQGEAPILYRNNGDGTFTDVSERSGVARSNNRYGLGVLTADFDNDGWPDIYVANDTTPSVLFHNNHDGTFTDVALISGCAMDDNGKEQAGMGVSAGDYNADGWLDIFKTNFSNETPNLYRNIGGGRFTDETYAAGTAAHTLWVGWGCGFFDPDNDGWLDLFYGNGHVYPELERANLEIKFREPRVLFRNLGNGRFEDVSALAGPAVTEPSLSRGMAFGDFNNDGSTDIVINNMNGYPSLLRCDRKNSNHWIAVRLIGVKSNRSGIGSRVKCTTGKHSQIDEVRSGGSYLSQNDLRLHFGLGSATQVDALEIAWPSGHVDLLKNVPADRISTVWEGGRFQSR
ncbi:MAG TPA: CRTAC1 family protein [Bryobacteraceae bacterium]|nr:CRTAC1 family protein [Bryobacteraceae bacterium]